MPTSRARSQRDNEALGAKALERTETTAMAFGVMVIGDEMLVGERQDKHLSFSIAVLATGALRLAWAEYRGDDRPT